MAHFAQIENNIVQRVIVVANDDAPDEVTGQTFLASIGLTGVWKQTSYNNNFRGRYAGIGYTYNADLDEFVAPLPEQDKQ